MQSFDFKVGSLYPSNFY